jgi:IS605 OrfB family transposase
MLKMINFLTQTVETKIEDTTLYPILDNLANYYCHIEKVLYNCLFNREITKDFRNQLKSRYIIEYNISGRLFNTIFNEVKAKIDSVKVLHSQSLKDSEKKIKVLKEKIKNRQRYISTNRKLTKKDIKKLWLSIFQWKQKIDRLNQYIKFYKPSKILFGTKNFYKKQWTVDEYKTDHDVWLKEWRRKRNLHFSFIGTKVESCGNQLCQFYIKDEQDFLQIRLPNSLNEKYGKYINVPVKFHSDRPNKKYYKDFISAVTSGISLSYKFIKRENNFWYVSCNFSIKKEIKENYFGCIGIDINYGLIATTSVDKSGNFLEIKNYEYDPETLSSEQIIDLISTQLDEIVQKAKLKGYCISAEDIDLSKKKLIKYNSITNHKINTIAYDKIWKLLISKCFRSEVFLIGINPAYTSFIGHYKYEKMYGLSQHNAAAMCIARRGLGLKDKLPAFIASVLHSGEASKKKPIWESIYRHRHHWAHWAYLKQNLERCSLLLQKELGDPTSGLNPTFEDLLTSRFNPSYLSFIGR